MFCYREIFGFCIQHDLLMPFMNSVVLRYFCWHRGGLGSYLVWVYAVRVLGFWVLGLTPCRVHGLSFVVVMSWIIEFTVQGFET